MQINKPILIVCLLAIAAVWLIPGLSSSQTDKIVLSCTGLAMAITFMTGSNRILKKKDISQSRFNALWFGTMAIRMILSLIFIVIFLVFSGINKIPGAILLILQYFVYMGFEIRSILPKLRTDSEKSPKSDDARK